MNMKKNRSQSLELFPKSFQVLKKSYSNRTVDKPSYFKLANTLCFPCLLGLSDVTANVGGNGEIKCYVLTCAGLTTLWEKDGKPLKFDNRVKIFETRGVRRLTIRNMQEDDAGVYSVRILGPSTNLFSQCKINVTGIDESLGLCVLGF
jgi:hypothetical protein